MTNNIRAETLPLPVLQSKSMDREVRRLFLQLSPLRLMSIKNTSVESVRRSWQLCVKAFASREPVGAVVEKRDYSTVAGSHLPMAAEGIEWLQSRISRLTDLNDPTISPLRSNDLVGLPPAIVLTAGFDPLREEALAYARRLASSGVSVRLIHFPGQFHGFLSFDKCCKAPVTLSTGWDRHWRLYLIAVGLNPVWNVPPLRADRGRRFGYVLRKGSRKPRLFANY